MKTLLLLLALVLSTLSISDIPEPTTYKIFDVNDYTWLAGTWSGDGFGGTSEESWSQPINGTMMGMYRHINAEGELVFYEFMLLNENGIRLKHFNPDLTGWEEKNDMMTFTMIRFSNDKIEMEGLTYERISDSEIEIRLVMDQGDETHTEIFSMKKTTP